MSITKRINSLYTKLYLFNANLMMAQGDAKQITPKDKPQGAGEPLSLNECTLKSVQSTTYKNHIQAIFEKQLNQNIQHYTKAVTSYYANLILFNAVQSDNGVALTPENLNLYNSLEELFPLVTLVDTPHGAIDMLEYTTLDKLTLEGVLRWFTDTYVRTQFEYMLLEEVKETALIDHVLFQEENIPPLRKCAVDVLINAIGEVYFIRLRAKLLNTLRDKSPIDLFKAGEFEARLMTNSHSKHMETTDKENEELLESISRVNNLWLRVIMDYENLFKEKLPKGRVNEEVYDYKLVLVLRNLRNEGVTTEEIQELSTLDNKLELSVRRKIASFDFIRG